MALFVDSSGWENHKTKNWAISSGGSASLGVVVFGEAKLTCPGLMPLL